MKAKHAACIQHPAGDRDDNTVADLYVDEFTGCAALVVHGAQSSAVQRVPTVEELNFLPDTENCPARSLPRSSCIDIAEYVTAGWVQLMKCQRRAPSMTSEPMARRSAGAANSSLRALRP